MGSYDGAEVCELVGLYILNELKKEVPKEDVGLYRDDGLIIVKHESGPTLSVSKVFPETFYSLISRKTFKSKSIPFKFQ